MWNEIEEKINLKEDIYYLQLFNINIIDNVKGIVKIKHTKLPSKKINILKEVIIYENHVEFLLNVVFLLSESNVNFKYNIAKNRKEL